MTFFIRHTLRIAAVSASATLLSGCLARTAYDIVTLPVKVASAGVDAVGAGVDAVTTSQSEADQKRGEALRERDERVGQLSRKRSRAAAECAEGDDEECRRVEELTAEIDAEMAKPL